MNALPRPEQAHIDWQNREFGVLLHLDLEVFDKNYLPFFWNVYKPLPGPEVFNPAKLDTDQWLECCAAAGAKSAVLTMKHASGFTMFPTSAHPFGVHSSPWRNGQGDIARDFVKSCQRYGLKPGFYFSVVDNDYLRAWNNRMRFDATMDWAAYIDSTLLQLRELWSRYGDLGEIWFDGGMWQQQEDREKLADLVNELQPNAVCFGGDPALVKSARHCGNEDGDTIKWTLSGFDGRPLSYLDNQRGQRDGRYYCPMECIIPNRDNDSFMMGWFCKDGEDNFCYRPEELVERYYASIGHNATLLTGLVINRDGLIPEPDVRQLTQFGKLIKEEFSQCVAHTAGQPGQRVLELENPERRTVNMLELMEDFREGERIGRFKLYGLDEEEREIPLVFGDSVGHKLLERFPATAYARYRLRIQTAFGGEPTLLKFALYQVPRR